MLHVNSGIDEMHETQSEGEYIIIFPPRGGLLHGQRYGDSTVCPHYRASVGR
jgi:hypothetical protein